MPPIMQIGSHELSLEHHKKAAASVNRLPSTEWLTGIHRRQPTFATWGNSGIEPDKGKGISSPGTYEARLMWPRNDGERQWNTMSDWTCR